MPFGSYEPCALNQGFFDADALEGKSRRERAAWRCKLLGALCKHLVQAHSEFRVRVRVRVRVSFTVTMASPCFLVKAHFEDVT